MSSASAENSENWLKLYDGLLAKYVTPVGVKYAEWKKSATDRQALQKVVDAIAQANVATSGKEDQLAFYLNAYNAWILHEALAKYPTRSVKDPLFAFFLGKRIKVTGEEMSFNHLEKDIVRARFEEPRVHFALNCASRSCPPLNRQAFRGRELESQLEKLSRAFVNSENGVKVSADKKSAQLSKIFDWYKEDFKKEGGVLTFINKRRDVPLSDDVKISYQDYNWSLNETK